MNNFQFPFLPMGNNINIYNLDNELNKIKEDIKIIKEKINKLEKEKENTYLKKDDNYYMI